MYKGNISKFHSNTILFLVLFDAIKNYASNKTSVLSFESIIFYSWFSKTDRYIDENKWFKLHI